MRRGRIVGVVMLLAIAAGAVVSAERGSAAPVSIGAPAPDIAGGPWIGSAPLTMTGLRGRVVLVEFWTHG